MENVLGGFIAPQSIAVVGAIDNTRKSGGKIVENLLVKAYGGELLLINPNSHRIQNQIIGSPIWISDCPAVTRRKK